MRISKSSKSNNKDIRLRVKLLKNSNFLPNSNKDLSVIKIKITLPHAFVRTVTVSIS